VIRRMTSAELPDTASADSPQGSDALGSRRMSPAALVTLAAVVWWAVGYFPWLASWVTSLVTVSGRGGGGRPGGERLAVPLAASSMWLLVLGALVGGVLAGMLGLLARPGHRRSTALATLSGAGLAVMVAGGQAVAASGVGSAFPSEDPRVLAGLCVVLALSALTGWAFGACAPLGRTGTGLALAVLAGATPLWLTTSMTQLLSTSATGRLGTHTATILWAGLGVGGLVLAVALGVIGVRPSSRLAWWPVALLVAWTVSPVLTAVTYLQPLIRPGSRVPRVLGDTVRGTANALASAAAPGARSLTPWVAAIVIGAGLALMAPRLLPSFITQPSAAEREPRPQIGSFILAVFLWMITVGGALFGAAGVMLALWSSTYDDSRSNGYTGYGVALGTVAAMVGVVVSLVGIVGLRQRQGRPLRQD